MSGCRSLGRWAEFSGRIPCSHGVSMCYVEAYVFFSYKKTEFLNSLVLTTRGLVFSLLSRQTIDPFWTPIGLMVREREGKTYSSHLTKSRWGCSQRDHFNEMRSSLPMFALLLFSLFDTRIFPIRDVFFVFIFFRYNDYSHLSYCLPFEQRSIKLGSYLLRSSRTPESYSMIRGELVGLTRS
jgi:hypothetical protein